MFASIRDEYNKCIGQLGMEGEYSVLVRPSLLGSLLNTPESYHYETCRKRVMLFRAAALDDIDRVNSLLAGGIDADARNSVTTSLARFFGKMSSNAQQRTIHEPSDNLTPLHFAAFNGHSRIVELLISKGANVNAKDDDGITPIHLAAGSGNKEIVKLLLRSRADINASNIKGIMPLHLAAEEGHLDLVKFLISSGADPNSETHNFSFDERTGERSVLQYDIRNWTPLHFSINKKHYNVVQKLLKVGIILGNDYVGPLYLAEKDFFLKVVKFLMSLDEHLEMLETDRFQKLFELAISKRCLEVIKILVQKGIDVNAKYDGKTPLHHIVRYGMCYPYNERSFALYVVKALLQHGADTNSQDSNGRTPLDYTVMARYDEADIL